MTFDMDPAPEERNPAVSNINKRKSDSPAPKKVKLFDDDSESTPRAGLGATARGDSVNKHGSVDIEDSPPKWFVEFFAQFENRLESRIESMITRKIQEHEEKLKSHEFDILQAKEEITQLKQENEKLAQKIDDIENRSRRNNLVFFGLPEAKDDPRKEDCHKTIKKFLRFAGVEEGDIEKIERCHRTPTHPIPVGSRVSSSTPAPPRRVHVAFSSFPVKEKIRKLCIQKLKSSKYLVDDSEEARVYVAEDLSVRVLQLRKKKQSQFDQLKKEKKKPFFLFPDKIAYREDGTGRLIVVK